MTILRTTHSWGQVERADRVGRRPRPLTPEEQAHARRALRRLRTMHGNAYHLAKPLGASRTTIAEACSKAPISADLACRIARLAGVSVDAIVTGAWPVLGVCPTCGRSDALPNVGG